ncbi:hypothetical protein CAOG_006225 [Capsaspora owczarzaki ATCC 30864]|uniref:CENP-T/Histone H4 histone fold domain-containing protein n=2 Tax=Capsaspora owczarzaki (strain ATCC 30864) TaxID=595528 RepID=A0A0D2WUU9_CAPO3|nr:hypothetical protein CAOG_006225 [Capsaspora owczarzaki ATCC 30864]
MAETPRRLMRRILLEAQTPAPASSSSSSSSSRTPQQPATSSSAAPSSSARPAATPASTARRRTASQASTSLGPESASKRSRRIAADSPRGLIRAVSEDLAPPSTTINRNRHSFGPSAANTAILASATKARATATASAAAPMSARSAKAAAMAAGSDVAATPRTMFRGALASMDTPLDASILPSSARNALAAPSSVQRTPVISPRRSVASTPSSVSSLDLSALPSRPIRASNGYAIDWGDDDYADEVDDNRESSEESSLTAAERARVDEIVDNDDAADLASQKSVFRAPYPVTKAPKGAASSASLPHSKRSKEDELPVISAAATRALFLSFCKASVPAATMEVVQRGVDEFLNQAADDLVAFAQHAKRKTIDAEDVVFLMRRQKQIQPAQTIETLSHAYLPREYIEAVIPIARAHNIVEP